MLKGSQSSEEKEKILGSCYSIIEVVKGKAETAIIFCSYWQQQLLSNKSTTGYLHMGASGSAPSCGASCCASTCGSWQSGQLRGSTSISLPHRWQLYHPGSTSSSELTAWSFEDAAAGAAAADEDEMSILRCRSGSKQCTQ